MKNEFYKIKRSNETLTFSVYILGSKHCMTTYKSLFNKANSGL